MTIKIEFKPQEEQKVILEFSKEQRKKDELNFLKKYAKSHDLSVSNSIYSQKPSSPLTREQCEKLYEKGKKLLAQLPLQNLAEHMEMSIRDQKESDYSSDKVDSSLDFFTNTTSNKGLAFANVTDMFCQWQQLGKPKNFYNYEGGAQEGNLAFDTLTFAKEFSECSLALNNGEASDWSDFYQALHYVIVEISPALAKHQSLKCQEYIQKEKLTILRSSAFEFKPISKIHRFCSNGLIDGFPLQGFTQDQHGNILALTKLKVLHKNSLDRCSVITEEKKAKIIEADIRYREQLKHLMLISDLPSNVYIVNKKLFSDYEFLQSDEYSEYWNLCLPVFYFDNLKEVFKQNLYILPDLKPDKMTYINVNLAMFAQCIQSAERVLFFEYGDVGSQIENVNFFEIMHTFGKKDFKTQLYGYQTLILSTLSETYLKQALSLLYQTKEVKDLCDIKDRDQLIVNDGVRPIRHIMGRFANFPEGFKVMVLSKDYTPEEENTLPSGNLMPNTRLSFFYNPRQHEKQQEKSNTNKPLQRKI